MDLLPLACRQLFVLAVLAATTWAAGWLASRALRREDAQVPPPDIPGPSNIASPPLVPGNPIVPRLPVLPGPPTLSWRAIGPWPRIVPWPPIVPWPAIGPRPPIVPWPLTLAIGLALITQALAILGLLGWLRAPVLIPLVVGLLVAAAIDWHGARGERRRAASLIARASGSDQTHAIGRPLAMVAMAALWLPPFVLTLYPPLGFDQTMYHLPMSRAFAESGGLPVLPALRYPVFPPLAEVLNAAVLLFADDVATQVVGWFALVACTGLIVVWAGELRSGADRQGSLDQAGVDQGAGSVGRSVGGWVAAAVFAGSPMAPYLAATGYVEPLLALLCLAALYAASHAHVDGRTRTAWVVTAGLLAGSAAGTKYLGLYFVPATALVLLSGATPRRWPSVRRDLAIYSVAAAIALAPSYGRLLVHTGNPLYPFYPAIFGTSAWANQDLLGKQGLARLVAASTLLWDITFRREMTGGMPFFSPAFAFGVPIALVAAWWRPMLRLPLLIACVYVLAAPTHAHYFLAIAPLFSIAIGLAASWVVARGPGGRRALAGVALLLTLGGEAYVLHRIGRLGWPPTTEAGRDALFRTQLPLYPAVAFLNRASGDVARRTGVPVVAYSIGAQRMVYYSDATLLGDYNGPTAFARIAARVREGRSLSEVLATLGVSYLLVPEREAFWTTEASTDPWLQRVYADGHATVYSVVPIRNPGERPGGLPGED